MRKFLQPCYFCCCFSQICHPFFSTAQATQGICQRAAKILLKQMADRHNRFPSPKEIVTAAAGSLTTMDMQALHLIPCKGEGRIPFDIAVFQKHRSKSFSQGFVAKLIQLVPLALIQPLFLIPLGGGFRYFFIGYQFNRHFSSST